MPDYYKILALSPGATTAQIKAAYHRLAKIHHPDVNNNSPQSQARFREINEAYETLLNSDGVASADSYPTNNDSTRAGETTQVFDAGWYVVAAQKRLQPIIIILLLIGGLVAFAVGVFFLMGLFYNPIQSSKTVILPYDSFVNRLMRSPVDSTHIHLLDSLVNSLPASRPVDSMHIRLLDSFDKS